MKIKNYIAIRFSLILKPEWLKKAYAGGNREDWFRTRSDIFKKWTKKSIDNQTSPVERVFIFMDVSDQSLWENFLNLPSPYFPIFCAASAQGDVLKMKIMESGSENIMLSRIDSDDAIASDYIENINKSVRPESEKEYIVSCNGFISNLKAIQSIYYNCCPFISLYTRKYDGTNIYGFEHEKVLEKSPILNKDALWMQIIHGTNIANKLHRKSRFEEGDHRIMEFGPDMPALSAWPMSFPNPNS